MIKHDGHLGNVEARVFYISLVFHHNVIYGLGFFIGFLIWILHAQNKKTRLFLVFTQIKHGFLTNHSTRRVLAILMNNYSPKWWWLAVDIYITLHCIPFHYITYFIFRTFHPVFGDVMRHDLSCFRVWYITYNTSREQVNKLLTAGPHLGPLVAQQISVLHMLHFIQSQPSFLSRMISHCGQCIASPPLTMPWKKCHKLSNVCW